MLLSFRFSPAARTSSANEAAPCLLLHLSSSSNSGLPSAALWPSRFASRLRYAPAGRRFLAQGDWRSPRSPLNPVDNNLRKGRAHETGASCRCSTIDFDGVLANANAANYGRLGKGATEVPSRGFQLRVRRPPMKLAPAIDELVRYKQALGNSYTTPAAP